MLRSMASSSPTRSSTRSPSIAFGGGRRAARAGGRCRGGRCVRRGRDRAVDGRARGAARRRRHRARRWSDGRDLPRRWTTGSRVPPPRCGAGWCSSSTTAPSQPSCTTPCADATARCAPTCGTRSTTIRIGFVGRQDLTAHVDVTAVERAADAAGLTTIGITTQAEALMGLGIEERLREIQADPATTFEDYTLLRSALLRLLDPAAMGRFRFMVFGRDWPLRARNSTCSAIALPGRPGRPTD